MWPDRVLNPGPLTYKSGALPTALHGPATTPVNVAIANILYYPESVTFLSYVFKGNCVSLIYSFMSCK